MRLLTGTRAPVTSASTVPRSDVPLTDTPFMSMEPSSAQPQSSVATSAVAASESCSSDARATYGVDVLEAGTVDSRALATGENALAVPATAKAAAILVTE